MNFKMRVLRITVLSILWFLPSFALANSCPTTTLNNLLGTTCAIGDVSFAFTANSFTGSGVAENSIILTPDASDPLNPGFSLAGPFSVTATGLGSSAQENFSFFWAPTVLDSLFQISSATATLINPTVPQAPNFGYINGGNNLGFTSATIQTGGPNSNPNSVGIDQSEFQFPDGYFGSLFVADGTGNGATTSVDAFEHQYHLTLVPEPSSLLLLSVGLLGLIGALLSRK